MPVLFELLEQETEPAARAVWGPFIFVFIHPYGRQRKNGALPDEYNAGFRRLSLDGDTGRKPQTIYAGIGTSRRPTEYTTFTALIARLANDRMHGKTTAELPG